LGEGFSSFFSSGFSGMGFSKLRIGCAFNCNP
jgi:hypothetical protein